MCRELFGCQGWCATAFVHIITGLTVKVEIKLKKAVCEKWGTLERAEGGPITEEDLDPKEIARRRDMYPSSKGKKDW